MIPIKINQSSHAAHVSHRSIPRSRIARAVIASMLIASGCAAAPLARIEANTKLPVLNGLAAIDEHDSVLAIAPLLAISVEQSEISLPRQGVGITLGMARGHMTRGSDWTASSHTGWYYYNSDPSQLSPRTMLNHRVQGSVLNVDDKPGTVHLLQSPVPTAPHEYCSDFGDHDSIGHSTYYIRVPFSKPPADGYFAIKWDESSFGEDNHALSTIEWWHDLTDSATAEAVANWDPRDRYIVDPRTGKTIDLAGRKPTVQTASPVRGAQRTGALPEGTQKIFVRVTNSAGLSTEMSVVVVVGETIRIIKVVSATGDYSSLSSAIAAANADSDPYEIVIEGGHSETIDPAGISITADGTLIRWDGNGARPEIHTANWGLTIEGDGCTIDGIEMRSTVANENSMAFSIKGKRCVLNDCSADGVDGSTHFGYAYVPHNALVVFNADSGSDYTLIQSCRCSQVYRYIVGGASGAGPDGDENKNLPFMDLMVIGCEFIGTNPGPSLIESTIRDLGLYYSPVYAYNDLNEYTKDALRQMQTDHALVFANRLDKGCLRIGLSSTAGVHKAIHIRVEANELSDDSSTSNVNGLLTIKPGCRYAAIVNNVLIHDKGGGVFGGAGKPGLEDDVYVGYCECRDIVIAHNTIELKAGYGNSGKPISGFGINNPTYVSGTSFANNLIIKHAGHSGDVWKAGVTSFVDNDVLTGSLNARHEPSVFAGSHATIAGVVYDFYGTRREASSSNGAAIDAPPEAPPSYLTTLPMAGSTGVSTTLPNITILFAQEMTSVGASGSMRILDGEGSEVGSWIPSDWLINQLDRRMVTLNVGIMLSPGAAYSFVADAGTLMTYQGDVDWPGISDPNQLRWVAAGSSGGSGSRGVRVRGRSRARGAVAARGAKRSVGRSGRRGSRS